MVEPTVFDARQGLSRAAIRELKQATRVAIGMKNSQTAVLGCWTRDAAADGQQTDHFCAILVTSKLWCPLEECEQRFATIEDAQQDHGWSRFVAVLGVGDILKADGICYRSAGAPQGTQRALVGTLGVDMHDGFSVSFRLRTHRRSG